MEILPAAPNDPPPNDDGSFADVGGFQQGSPISRWALARYLVGRAVAESVTRSMLFVALLVLGLAAVLQWVANEAVWSVLVAIVGFGILGMRALLKLVINRVTAADQVGPLEDRLRALISDTRSDVFAEMRRIGLPGHTWTLPLFAFRFVGRNRRRSTVAKLRNFDVERAVPSSRLDELHLLMNQVIGRPDRLSR